MITMRLKFLHNCMTCKVLQYVHRRYISKVSNVLSLSEEVASAVHVGQPLVALETTIVTHGMPHPENIRTAIEVEDIVRSGGATPATIGILSGRIHVGLSLSQLEFLADPNTSSIKTSRRDLPFVISQRLHGGTTVSGTMVVAHMAGIPIFATGGIGGVHRGAESSMDVSADLTELGRTPVAVVSAGIKSILDIGRSLEYLETQGVCVSTFGSTREFPAFFSRRSGFMAPYSCETARQAAEMIYAGEHLQLQSGSLIAVPIPEQYDTLGQEIETVIQNVLEEAGRMNLKGNEVTPYILRRVNKLTLGKSLKANIHLMKNNVEVATKIAVELGKLRKGDTGDRNVNSISLQGKRSIHTSIRSDTDITDTQTQEKTFTHSTTGSAWRAHAMHGRKKVCVVGGSIVDFTARMATPDFRMNGGTYSGTVQQSFGGVGRNIADCLSRLDVDTLYISALGNDSHRTAFESHCKHMNLEGVIRLVDYNTATYCAVLRENGELLFGIGDMDIHAQITPQYISQFEEDLMVSSLVCVDGNISAEAIEYVCSLCSESGVPVFFEPTDIHKASKPFMTTAYHGVTYVSPNFNELKTMTSYLSKHVIPVTGSANDLEVDTVLHECSKLLNTVSAYIPITLVTLGRHGVVLCYHGDRHSKLPVNGDLIQRNGSVVMEHYPCIPGGTSENIVSVSGAGDCLAAAFISQLLEGQDPSYCIRAGLLAARMSLQSSQAVPDTLTRLGLSREITEEEIIVLPRYLI